MRKLQLFFVYASALSRETHQYVSHFHLIACLYRLECFYSFVLHLIAHNHFSCAFKLVLFTLKYIFSCFIANCSVYSMYSLKPFLFLIFSFFLLIYRTLNVEVNVE